MLGIASLGFLLNPKQVNSINKLGGAAILVIIIAFFLFTCNKKYDPSNNTTINKTDTIVIKQRVYIYGTGKASKIVRVVDTFRLVDTMVIYSDSNIYVSISDLDSSRPTLDYRISENITKQIVTVTKYKSNYIAVGAAAGYNSLTPMLTYGTRKANYSLAYDLINKTTKFGLTINIATFAKLDHHNRNSTGLTELGATR